MMNGFQNTNIYQICLIVVLCFFSTTRIFACDLCGCSTSSGSSSFGTLDNLSFIGVRYIYQDFESKNGIFSNSPKSTEKFNTYQIWSRVPLSKSIYINAVVPYQDLNRMFDDRIEHLKGLGDITLIGWYEMQFYKKKSSKNNEVDFNEVREQSGHRLNLGLGFKLPTGEFEEQLTDRINPGFQLGTGSLDGIFSIMHTYSKNKFGINTLATYYLKSKNKNQYRFGNQFSIASNIFYNLPLKNSAFNPFLGVSLDVYNSIEQYDEILPDTNGTIFNGSLGSEYMTGKFLIGANYTLPLSQNLFGDNVTLQNRFSIFLNYVL